MGVLNKLKNIFYDEVEVEEDDNNTVELNNIKLFKKEPKKIEIEENKQETVKEEQEVNYKTIKLDEEIKDDIKEEVEKKTDNTFDERDLFRSERTFNFVDFNDEEEQEIDRTSLKRNVLNEENRTIQKDEVKIDNTPKAFKPTPVISPIWGVLDKDYKKEEIKEKSSPKESVSSSVTKYDSVRKKAYGTLEDELEDTLNSINKLSTKKIKEEVSKVDRDVELLEQKTQKIEDLISKIEDATNESNNELTVGDLENDFEEENNDKTLTDNTLEHDLFNLIDSMYDE